jgi:predicted membrane-bound spermidine synthase
VTRHLLVTIAAVLSGAAALAYEIAWSRALVVPLGNSADAAALVLAGFMLGIAAGARLFGGLAERTAVPLRLYALLELGLGLYAVVAPRLLSALGLLSGGGALAVRAAAAFVLVATPGLAMGATLPLLVRALAPAGARLRLFVGLVYAANTLGAAAGAFAAGFWAIAELGIRLTSAAAGALGLAAAALAFLASTA